MRRLFLLLLIFFPVASSAADFPGTPWGAGEAVIRDREKASLFDESTPGEELKALFVNERIADLDAFVIYLLSRDQLVLKKYLFAGKHTNFQKHLPEYDRVGAFLRRQYGEPVESGEIRRNGTFGDQDLGRMIAVGQVILMSRWETDDTVITHVLRGESLNVTHEINFFDKSTGAAYRELMQDIKPPARAVF